MPQNARFFNRMILLNRPLSRRLNHPPPGFYGRLPLPVQPADAGSGRFPYPSIFLIG
jgi:hypothetical protein